MEFGGNLISASSRYQPVSSCEDKLTSYPLCQHANARHAHARAQLPHVGDACVECARGCASATRAASTGVIGIILPRSVLDLMSIVVAVFLLIYLAAASMRSSSGVLRQLEHR